MERSISIFLDLARFLAAVLVFISHVEQVLDVKSLSFLASFGHDAVIFFFMLSGFVIAYVTTNKEVTLREYVAARVARILPVSVASLLLVFALIWIGHEFNPDYYDQYVIHDWWRVLGVSAFFLNNSFLSTVSVPTNGPYWSVSYEVWYYVAYGVVFYLSGLKRALALLLVAAVAGVKIALLMPIWLLGVWCFRWHGRLVKSFVLGLIVTMASLALYAVIRYKNIDDYIFIESSGFWGGVDASNEILGWSKRFVADYVLSLLFMALFAGLFMMRESVGVLFVFFEKPIRIFASFTFSLYLFHYPLLVFVFCYFKSWQVVMIITMFWVGVLSLIVEQQKPFYKKLVLKLT